MYQQSDGCCDILRHAIKSLMDAGTTQEKQAAFYGASPTSLSKFLLYRSPRTEGKETAAHTSIRFPRWASRAWEWIGKNHPELLVAPVGHDNGIPPQSSPLERTIRDLLRHEEDPRHAAEALARLQGSNLLLRRHFIAPMNEAMLCHLVCGGEGNPQRFVLKSVFKIGRSTRTETITGEIFPYERNMLFFGRIDPDTGVFFMSLQRTDMPPDGQGFFSGAAMIQTRAGTPFCTPVCVEHLSEDKAPPGCGSLPIAEFWTVWENGA